MKVAIIVESMGLAFYEPIQELLVNQIDDSGDPNSRGATLKYRICDPESGFAADPNRHRGEKIEVSLDRDARGKALCAQYYLGLDKPFEIDSSL